MTDGSSKSREWLAFDGDVLVGSGPCDPSDLSGAVIVKLDHPMVVKAGETISLKFKLGPSRTHTRAWSIGAKLS